MLAFAVLLTVGRRGVVVYDHDGIVVVDAVDHQLPLGWWRFTTDSDTPLETGMAGDPGSYHYQEGIRELKRRSKCRKKNNN